jgi:hypothetical protein
LGVISDYRLFLVNNRPACTSLGIVLISGCQFKEKRTKFDFLDFRCIVLDDKLVKIVFSLPISFCFPLFSFSSSSSSFFFFFFQAFSPVELPSLSYLNLRGNPLEQNSVGDLLEVLKGFPCLQSLEVVLSDIATVVYDVETLLLKKALENLWVFRS